MQTLKEAVSTTTIAFFGSTHQDEMQKKFGWDDGKSIALFDWFHPDMVCGEVRRSDYESNADYQGPSEYRRYTFNYCKERGIPFIPCDFFRDEDIELAQRPLDVPDEEAVKEFEQIAQDFFAIGAKSAPPFNSAEFNDLVRKKQGLQYKYAPEVHEIIWNQRNRQIVENITAVVKENRGKNILVIFGAEHIYWLVEELEKLDGVSICFPL